MAYATNTAASASFIARIRGIVEGVKASLALYGEYRRTFDELNALSDRELADINISRADIPGIARAHSYGA